MLYGEHAHGRLSQLTGDFFGINWWTSGDYGDTTFSTTISLNYYGNEPAMDPLPVLCPRQGNVFNTAASMHPGGANFAFCDGSVKFLKNSINSWNPSNIGYSGGVYNLNGQNYGVYQALSTRNGGEVISADSY
jgi:prepilin-type processing-associated H-X9-DG protein